MQVQRRVRRSFVLPLVAPRDLLALSWPSCIVAAMTSTTRELFVHPDPAAVGAWCHEHAVAGTVFVAPSAAARRAALRYALDRSGVTLGITATSRGRFLALLESRAGLPAPKLMADALERLLVADCAAKARVPLFDDAGHAPPAGAVSAVARLIRSLRLNGVAPSAFADAGGDTRAADAYARFERRRAELDVVDEADRVRALIATGVPSLDLVIEDLAFPHRSARELYLAAIAASRSCRIGAASLGANDEMPVWTSDLERLGFVTQDATAALSEPARRAIGGVGMQDEIELVAREMLALLHGGSMKAQDVLAVAPNAHYLGRLSDACNRLGIPVASPRRVGVADVPLVRALLDTFRLLADAAEDTPERGLALLATPYVGLPLHVHDKLARALTLHGLGSLRSWHRFAAGTGRERFVRLAADVARMATRLDGERSPRELATALSALGLDLGFLSSGRRSHLRAGRDDALRTDQQGWEALTAAADELNEALRRMDVARITARRWLGELTEVISGVQVRVDAKARDGVHLAIAGAGLPSAAHVFAVGWREGLVPRRTREDPLLPERVKRALNERGALFPLVADRAAQEQERRERVRRAARETLTLSWPATGEDGERQLPSFYMDDLDVAQEDRHERSVGDTTWPLPLAASRGERVARATFLARHKPAANVGDELKAVRDTLSALTKGEKRAYDGLLHAGQVIQLPPEVLTEVGPMAGRMSASQVRTVVHCLYEHFGKRRLGLEQLGAPQLGAPEIGNIAHAALRDLGRVGFDPAKVGAILAECWQTLVPEEADDTPAALFEREILSGNLSALAEQEHALLALSGATAGFFELAFGLDGEGRDPASLAQGLSIDLPSGSAIATSLLRGSIDRVDVIERDGKRYGVAIDYKSGKGESYGKELTELADFQLPIYCEVLPLFGIEPVGAFYLGIASGERYGVVRSDFASAFAREADKGVKKLDADAFDEFMRARRQALRQQVARVANGVLVVKPRNDDCKHCDLRPVCRIGTFGVGGASADD